MKAMINDSAETGGAILAAYITSTLGEERASKTSLEARGLALVTSSGAFVTLVLAIAAVANGKSVNVVSRLFLVLASIGFIAAAVLGIFVNIPKDYEEPTAQRLRELIQEHSESNPGQAIRAVADSEARNLAKARENNKNKAKTLRCGAKCQVAGLVLVGAAGIAVLIKP